MKIKNGLVFGADDKMHQKDLCFEEGVITECSSEGEYDATGCYVLPGFIDTHLHGLLGIHFGTTKKSLQPAMDWLSEHGVTGILPSVATRSKEGFKESFRKILEENDDRILGIHAEGPFLNKKFKGGMVEKEIVPPCTEYLKEIYDASEGTLKLLAMAPELEGAKEVIELCNELGIAVSMAHSDATYEQAAESVKWGISRMTHTYNAMRPLHHREPGLLGYALDDEKVNCELICDLVHVSAPMICLAIKAKGYQNITMISDSEMFCGLGDGVYDVDGFDLVVEKGVCKKKGTDTIAGSTKCLADGVKNLFDMGIPPEQIAVMASKNPAVVCGCTDRGSLDVGCRADVVILDEHFNVKTVFVKGKQVK